MMMRHQPTALLASIALLCCLLSPLAAQASEEIMRFHAEVRVLPDGTLDVTETIDYRLGAGLTKRGIFRDFPLTSPTGGNERAPVTFEVLSVTRNGRKEPHYIQQRNDLARVRIGDADVILPAPSEQTYVLRYRTEGQLYASRNLVIRSRTQRTEFEDSDQLVWNVTGNDWPFPIRQASVTVILPEDAKILLHAAYTGAFGSEDQNAEVTEIADGLFRARTTVPLAPREGFTVWVTWPPGLVDVGEPVRHEIFGLSYDQAAGVAGTLAGALALLVCWLVVGRDPKGGAIYPEFGPPKGIGPAAARYIQEQGFDNRCITAAIVSMAVKGALRIVEEGADGFFSSRDYKLVPLGSRDKGLSPAERAAYGEMFSLGGELELTGDKINGKRMDKARHALKDQLKEEHYGASFVRNWLYTLAGASVGVVTVAVLLLLIWQNVPSAFDRLGQWLIAGAAAGFIGIVVSSLLNTRISLPRGFGKLIGALLFIVPFGVGVFLGGRTLLAELQTRAGGELDVVLLGSGAVFGFLIALFHLLMARPTKAGRKLLDHIEGFALYLGTAEEERLNLLNPPERTPELFEKLLPYAIALGLAHQWSAQFAGVVGATTMPNWYHGSGHFDADRFDRNLGSAVSSTSAPSRGSGSGGGGFSGGGGGGGGGGSW